MLCAQKTGSRIVQATVAELRTETRLAVAAIPAPDAPEDQAAEELDVQVMETRRVLGQEHSSTLTGHDQSCRNVEIPRS